MTPIARFARWFTEDRGMKCEWCKGRLVARTDKFCSDECHDDYWSLHSIA